MRARGSRTILVAAVIAAAGCGSHNQAGFAPGSDAGSAAPDAGSTLCGPDCDHDGYIPPADCNDFNPEINPEAYDFITASTTTATARLTTRCSRARRSPRRPRLPHRLRPRGRPLRAELEDQRGDDLRPIVRAQWGQVSGLGTGETVYTSATKMEQINIVSSFGQNTTQLGKTMFGLSNGPWGAADPRSSPALDPAGFHLNDACSRHPAHGPRLRRAQRQHPRRPGLGAGLGGAHDLGARPEATRTRCTSTSRSSRRSSTSGGTRPSNDAFFVLVSNKTYTGTNVAKDAQGLAVTLNSGFFQLCPAYPGPPGLSQDKAAGLQQCVGMSGARSMPRSGSRARSQGRATTARPWGTNDTVARR